MTVSIVAELAQGFEGRPEQARLLLKAAAAAGADAAKYQLVYADELATPDYKHYGLFTTLEMGDDVWEGLAATARELRIELQLDIFGPRSLALAARIGAAAVKLHPTDIANVGLLDAVAAAPVPRVLLGAGGAHDTELQRALDLLADKDVVVLLGFQSYPTPTEANQIARVRALAERLGAARPRVTLGFADHASPDTPLRYALAAAALGAGARVIEKHLTLGRVMKLEDHESALDPDQFAEFVTTIRACADAIGACTAADDYGMSAEERGYRDTIRRHVVTARPLARGSIVAPADLVLKRTSSPGALTDLHAAYQRTLTRAAGQGHALTPADLD